MKIIHTADWHLGRRFHNISLLDDQKHVLEQLLAYTREYEVDVVLVAGDVYDRSVPPAQAVALLDETLHRLTTEAKAAVVMIAGNHDGAIRLAQGSRAMEASQVFISGPLGKSMEPVLIEDEHGPVYFCVLPYADPAEVRVAFGDETIRTHNEAVSAMTRQMLSHVPAGARTVAVGHCWVEGGANSESERPLTVGGTGEVGSDCFAGFSYTALGHLHRPQSVNEKVGYSGSLLKYSFSEIDHAKSLRLVELGADGEAGIEKLSLHPRRDLRIVEGVLEDILQGPADGESADDYLLVRLNDKGAILDAMGQLRAVYPNTLHIERPGLQINEGDVAGAGDHRRRTELDLFRDFHAQLKGEEPGPEQEAVLADVINEIHGIDRELEP